MQNKIKLIWHTERKLVSDLKNWSRNPRKISDESFEKLLERIKLRGFHDVIKIDTDSVVLSGNQRKKVLMKLNIKEVNVLIPNRKLTNDERNKIALESNVSDGQWDYEGLKSFNLDTLSDIGLNTEEISEMWNKNLEAENDDFDVEEELKKIQKPRTKNGDLIILGEHKLLCSDSTDPNAVKALFGNEKASVIYSDPPYNINLDYNKGVGNRSNYGGNVDDNKSAKDYREFIRKTLVNALSVSKKDVHCFYWCDEAWIYIFQTLYNELGIKNRRLNVWIKNNSSPTPTVAFNKTAEFCVYGTKGSPTLSSSLKNLNEVMNKELTNGNELHDGITNLWMIKRLGSSSYEHPTSKPPELHEKAIKRCSKVGDIIFDSFSGSFSTAICAEQLKRRVYSIETSEIFCDLAIRRWEKLTGRKVKIIKNYYEKE
jgi:site-specific DNA-methyltransferase (adenine-specific)